MSHPRASIISKGQELLIVEFMERHPKLYRGKVDASFTIQQKTELWEELAEKLNSHGGCQRTCKKWIRCWADYKSNVKKRAADIRRHNANPEGDPSNVKKLSEVDERCAALIQLWSETPEKDGGSHENSMDIQRPISSYSEGSENDKSNSDPVSVAPHLRRRKRLSRWNNIKEGSSFQTVDLTPLSDVEIERVTGGQPLTSCMPTRHTARKRTGVIPIRAKNLTKKRHDSSPEDIEIKKFPRKDSPTKKASCSPVLSVNSIPDFSGFGSCSEDSESQMSVTCLKRKKLPADKLTLVQNRQQPPDLNANTSSNGNDNLTQFGKYVVSLMRTLPIRTALKLQKDVISLILKEHLSSDELA